MPLKPSVIGRMRGKIVTIGYFRAYAPAVTSKPHMTILHCSATELSGTRMTT